MASLIEQKNKIGARIDKSTDDLLQSVDYYKNYVQLRLEKHAEATAERVKLYYEMLALTKKAKKCDEKLSKTQEEVSIEALAAMYTKIETLKARIAESNAKIDELLVQEQVKGDDALGDGARAMHAQVLVYRNNLAKLIVDSDKMARKMPTDYVDIAKDLSRTELEYNKCDARVREIENGTRHYICLSSQSSIGDIGKRDPNYELKVQAKERDREFALTVLEKIFKLDCEQANIQYKLSMKQAKQPVEEKKEVASKDQDVASTDDEPLM